jgi:hypothetical protein
VWLPSPVQSFVPSPRVSRFSCFDCIDCIVFALDAALGKSLFSSQVDQIAASKMPGYSDGHGYHGDDYSQYGDAHHNADPYQHQQQYDHNYDNNGHAHMHDAHGQEDVDGRAGYYDSS